MIPKTIHYCWFGHNPLPPDAIRCIESWKTYLPDYEIKEWNENNFDIHCIPFVEQAYHAKKYAFVSDYARFWILHEYGGLYFDTDVEIIRPMDDIIAQGAFMGCETSPTPSLPNITVAPGLCLGAEAFHPIYAEMIDLYRHMDFVLPDGKPDYITVVGHMTTLLQQHGLQTVNAIQTVANIRIYPKEYFCPISLDGVLEITPNTRSIHHYAQTWRPASHRLLRKFILRIGGAQLKNALGRLYRRLART